MAHMDSMRIVWIRMKPPGRCTVTTWLAEGVTEAITVTVEEVTTGVVDVVEREAADTDEGLILTTIALTKASCVKI